MEEMRFNNLEVDDFVLTEPMARNGFCSYGLKKNIVIFNKEIKKEKFKISTKLEDISHFIPRIINYLYFLENCKNYLIETFCEILDSYDENINLIKNDIINSNWYENLKISNISLKIEVNDGIRSDFYTNIRKNNNIKMGLYNEYNLITEINCIDNYLKDSKLKFEFIEKLINIEYYRFDIDKYISNNNEIENLKIIKQYLYKKYLHFNNYEDIEEIKAKNKSDICLIHNTKMNLKKIKIEYGLYAPPSNGYEDEKRILFLNCDDPVEGGCIVDEVGKYSMEYVCDLCNNARKEWKSKHESEICINLSRSIRDNILIFLNDKYINILRKEIDLQSYWLNSFTMPNGKYILTAKNKVTKKIYSEIEVELKNESIDLNLDEENGIYLFKINYKNEYSY